MNEPQAGDTQHGVVVVHGQGQDTKRGNMLAAVTNPIAGMLREHGHDVGFSFRTAECESPCAAHAKMTVRRRVAPETTAPQQTFHFREAFWDDAFPPPPANQVVPWLSRSLRRQIPAVVRGWNRDPVVDDAGRQHPNDTHLGAGSRWGRLSYLVLSIVSIPAGAILGAVGLLMGLVIYPLASLPGLNKLGLGWLNNQLLAAVNPFMSHVMGDTERVMKNEAWADNARSRVEAELTALIEDDSISDVTTIAYSAGCTVLFDALREGGPVEAALARRPDLPVHVVTVGSALNRVFVFAEGGRTHSEQRFLHQRVTAELTAGRTYDWTDIYARFDLVPGGPMRDAVMRATRVDEGDRLASRQVINYDSPLKDHFGYFDNREVVTPRLISAMYGGYAPAEPPDQDEPPEAAEHQEQTGPDEPAPPRAPVHVTREGTRQRSFRAGIHRVFSTGALSAAATAGGAYGAFERVAGWSRDLAFRLGDIVGPIGELRPVQWLGEQSDLTQQAADNPGLVGLGVVAGGLLLAGRVGSKVALNVLDGRLLSIKRAR